MPMILPLAPLSIALRACIAYHLSVSLRDQDALHTRSPSFFFLRIRPPPISTLFPYTALFRSPNMARRRIGGDFYRGQSRRVRPGPPVGTSSRNREWTRNLKAKRECAQRPFAVTGARP